MPCYLLLEIVYLKKQPPLLVFMKFFTRERPSPIIPAKDSGSLSNLSGMCLLQALVHYLQLDFGFFLLQSNPRYLSAVLQSISLEYSNAHDSPLFSVDLGHLKCATLLKYATLLKCATLFSVNVPSKMKQKPVPWAAS